MLLLVAEKCVAGFSAKYRRLGIIYQAVKLNKCNWASLPQVTDIPV